MSAAPVKRRIQQHARCMHAAVSGHATAGFDHERPQNAVHGARLAKSSELQCKQAGLQHTISWQTISRQAQRGCCGPAILDLIDSHTREPTPQTKKGCTASAGPHAHLPTYLPCCPALQQQLMNQSNLHKSWCRLQRMRKEWVR
jgi:hypothetical protein